MYVWYIEFIRFYRNRFDKHHYRTLTKCVKLLNEINWRQKAWYVNNVYTNIVEGLL